MEDYSQWNSPRSSQLSLPSIYSSVSKDINFQLELVNGMDHSEIYQGFDTHTIFPSSPISSRATPIEPDSTSQADRRSESPTQRQRYHHRRKQNREAQRRFRKRKEDRQKALELKVLELEAKCQELSDGFQQNTEVAQLLKDKEALKSENQGLLKLWQTMVRLMEQLDVLRSLSDLATLLTTNPPSSLNDKDKCHSTE
ncbi:hypothetical protein ZTR_04746 [Talaromyces verruculosus]|nr:hypothetical protein ZTR_04746 [Talaromyces verruculosus]